MEKRFEVKKEDGVNNYSVYDTLSDEIVDTQDIVNLLNAIDEQQRAKRKIKLFWKIVADEE